MASGSVRGDLRATEFLQFVGAKAEDIEIEGHLLQLEQFFDKPIVVPIGQFRRFVVGETVGLDLSRRQILGNMHGHLL